MLYVCGPASQCVLLVAHIVNQSYISYVIRVCVNML